MPGRTEPSETMKYRDIRTDRRGGIEGLPLQLMIIILVATMGTAIIVGWMGNIETPHAIGDVETPGPIIDASGGTVDGFYVEVRDQDGDYLKDAAVVFRTEDGRLKHQIIVDASNTTMAQTATVYLESVISSATGIPVVANTLYNPQLKSAYNFVPGIMGMIFILICAMMTSVSIVSEKESGTMNLLLVSPVRPRTIILGKLVPYFLLSCIILTLVLTLSYTVLGLPFSFSVINVIWVTILYVILALALGLLISTIASTQVSALLVSGVMFMIPVILLSGMIFPVENMPLVLQWLTCIIPARW